MIGPGAVAAINLLGGIGQGAMDAQMQNMNTGRTIEAQLRLAELQYQRQVQFWHMQNEYNSPAEQMKRFGAAGLNPHLIYGQGNPGNASGLPQYHPPDIQYRMAAPRVGPALESVLPTLMSVGTWMQNMRATELEIKQKQLMVDFLTQKNPREISRLDNMLSVFPYQKSMMQAKEQTAWTTWNQLLHEGKYKYGDDGMSGARAEEFLKLRAERMLKELSVDYYEPAMIMKLVGGGIGALAAGAGIGKLLSKRPPSTGPINARARRVKTYYQDGKRRSTVVDYD